SSCFNPTYLALLYTLSLHDALPIFVLIGEASHGTHEFYQTRARITQRLIEERDFGAVVVEADWPDAWRVNRWVRGFEDDHSAERSEEHTSELQSREKLVCRLLLEKK